VDEILVLERRATGERHAYAVVLRTGRGTERRLERAAGHRNVLDVVLIDRDALRGRRRIDRRRGVVDDDLLAAGLAGIDLLEHRRGAADANANATALDGDVGVVERDEVVTRWQLADLVRTVLVGDRGLRLRQRRRRHDDGDAGELIAVLTVG